MTLASFKPRRAAQVLAAALLTIAGFAAATPASATVVTFTFTGTVSSFTDVDNVYGFGAGANLAGDSVTDVYKIDTSNAVFSSGQPFGPGSAFNEFAGDSALGSTRATSTIDGHTIGFASGADVTAYVQQVYLGEGSPPNVYNQTILELQAIGFETSGSAIGSEFLIRDTVVTYSLQIPLSLTQGYSLPAGQIAPGANSGYQGVFFPYETGATAGYFDITNSGAAGVPEPATWSMLILGVGLVGLAARRRGRAHKAA